MTASGAGGHRSPVAGASSPVENMDKKFEEDFSHYIHRRNKMHRIQLGAVGAGIGGVIGVAASPVLLPGLALAALVGGAGGYQWAKRWGKHELQRHRAGKDDAAKDALLQNPTFRRLKYLVKWGHWQLLEYENSPPEWQCAVLDEVVRAFSPWVQKMYLLRVRGSAGESDPEAREVFHHLAPLYYMLQRRASVEAVTQSATSVALAFEKGLLDASCAERCSVVFPTILETISVLDRLSSATHAQLHKDTSASKSRSVSSENRATRRRRLRRLVDVLRGVLERPAVQQALQDRRLFEQRLPPAAERAAGSAAVPEEGESLDSPASSSGGRVKLLVPPEGVENEPGGPDGSADEELQYYSVSGESEDEATVAPTHRRSTPPKATSGDGSRVACFQRRLEAFPKGTANHTWTDFDAGEFDVRSDTYLSNRKKRPSEPAMFEIVNVDFQLVGSSGPVWRSAEHCDFYPSHCRVGGDKRFLLVMNWVFPPFQAVLTGALDPGAPWLANGSPQQRLWRKFLEMDDDGRKDVFKMIMSVEEGPWLVKRALPKRPVLIGKKLPMRTHYEPDRYLEIVFDVASGRTEQVAVGIVCNALRRLQLAFSALIEAREQDELPENILLSTSMTYLDPARLFSPEVE